MAKAKVVFHSCDPASQAVGTRDEHMWGKVYFTLEISGKKYEKLYVEIKQTVGSKFETGTIEVSPIKGANYRGPWNYDAFCNAVEAYYRSLVGSAGMGIHITGGAKNVILQNVRIKREHEVEFELSGPAVSW